MKLLTLTGLMLASFLAFGQNYPTHFVVAQDGSGDFKTIQEAIYASKTFPYETIRIDVRNGTYHEKVDVYDWNPNISLIGESRDGTVITYGDHFDSVDLGRNSTFHTYTMRVRGNDFRAENLTIINSAGPVGQAVALHVEADRAYFKNVSLKGHQDTLYVAGEGHRSWFKDCYIEGTIDFIFGGGTAFFDHCEIHSLGNAYVTAASTPETEAFGFVFQHCKLTAAKDITQVYLGRPWRKYARTVFMNSELGAHIKPEGWDNWRDPANEASVFYGEYHNTGAGAKNSKRVSWSHQLDADEASKYTPEKILRGWHPDK